MYLFRISFFTCKFLININVKSTLKPVEAQLHVSKQLQTILIETARWINEKSVIYKSNINRIIKKADIFDFAVLLGFSVFIAFQFKLR